jgi:hypothetical protein
MIVVSLVTSSTVGPSSSRSGSLATSGEPFWWSALPDDFQLSAEEIIDGEVCELSLDDIVP